MRSHTPKRHRSPLSAVVVAASSVIIVVLAAVSPAAANEPGPSDRSAQLVRQAIALIVNTPRDLDTINDKIVDAQAAPDTRGVDLAVLANAELAFKRQDMHEVRSLLERSIGAQPHRGNRDPLPIGQTSGSPGMTMATGAATGNDIAIDALAPDRILSGSDMVILAAFAAVAATGLWLAARFRPPPLFPNGTTRLPKESC